MPVPPQPCDLSRIFKGPKSNGTFRLILDLSTLNLYIRTNRFEITNDSTAAKLIQTQAWFSAVDIMDAFLHLRIRPYQQKYLAFSYRGQLYFAQSIPFGLCTAPMVYDRVINYPVALVHARQIQCLAYLDGYVIWSSSPGLLTQATSDVTNTLERLEFTNNPEISSLTSSQTGTWLGLEWHAIQANGIFPMQNNMN